MERTGKYAAVFRGTGATTAKTAMAVGTGTGANIFFMVGETISACENTANWTGTVLDNDVVDYKEGAASLTDTVAVASPPTVYETKYTPVVSLDFTHRRYVHFWIKCNRPSTAFTTAQIRLYTGANSNYYTIESFLADTWRRRGCVVRAPLGNSGTAADLSNITAISICLESADVTGHVLHLDWVTYNPQLCNVTAVYDDASEVAKTDYSASPSGVITFVTAPTNGHDITADYDYYATITQVAGAHNWAIESSAEVQEVTDYASLGVKDYITGNKGWTAKTERHWETADLFMAGVTYIVRFYVTLDVDSPFFYEGEVICSRDSLTIPQATVVNESLDLQGNKALFYVAT